MISCDNKSACHDPWLLGEDENGMRVICRHCKVQEVLRKDPYKRVPEAKQYVKFYKKDALQGNDNLFYRYHPEYLRT